MGKAQRPDINSIYRIVGNPRCECPSNVDYNDDLITCTGM